MKERKEYEVGERYYAPYTRGWQCLGEIKKVRNDETYLMYNKRHGYFVVTKDQLDTYN